MNNIKKVILDFMCKVYDKDKDTIKMSDLICYFNITPKDVLDHHAKRYNTKKRKSKEIKNIGVRIGN